MTRRPLGDALTAHLFGDAPAATDPVEWIGEQLGAELWSKQREIGQSVVANRYTAVQSANGCGKSFTAGRLAAWWVASHPIGEAIVVCTAPTGRQIDAVLWPEIRAAHTRGQLPGALTRNEWRVGPTLVALARKSTDFVDSERAASTFQGIHRRYVLVILDEASGIQPWLWQAVNALTTAETARVLALGNPLDPASRFAEVCAPGSGWHTIHVSAFDTPAFTGEEVSARVLEVLPSQTWIDEIARDYGEASPAYRSRVLGEFPDLSDDGLVSAAWVREAQDRELEAKGQAVLGVDVARTGDDETVILRNQGGRVRLAHAARGADLMATTGKVARLLAEDPEAHAVVDAIGIGAGVVDRLREQRLDAEGFNSSERADKPDRFANRRAESYWTLREELREGRLDLDPDDDRLASQLLTIRWQVNSSGKVQIESKDSMRRRGVSSPDRADALAMAVGGRRTSGQPTIALPPRANGLDESLGRPELGDLGSIDGAIGRVKW